MPRHNRLLEIGWFFLITAVLLIFSYTPIIKNYQATPTDRFYFGQSEYPLDMIGDLAYVQQGYQGHLLASFNYSTMIGSHPTILKFEYIAIGHAGRLLRIEPITMFIIGRFVISLGVLLIIYGIIRHIFSSLWQRILAYTFALFGAGIMVPGIKSTFDGYDVQIFPRLTQAMPHYLLGIGTMLLALYFLSRTLENPKRKILFIMSLLFGVAASLIYAPDNMFLISSFPLYILFDSISTYIKIKRIRIDWSKISILFAYCTVTIPPILFVRYVTLYLWDDIRTARLESLFPFHVSSVQYVLVVGIMYILSVFSVSSVIRKGKPLLLLFASWVVMHPVGEFIISPFLHLNYIYFLTPYYVAFGILAAMSVSMLVRLIQTRLINISPTVIALVLAVFILFTSIGTYRAVWDAEHVCFCSGQYFDFGYPKKSLMNGIFWLSENTKPDDIVLSYYFAGTLIPGFSGNRVYVSWWYRLIEPPGLNSTDATLQTFYSGHMPDAEAYAFVKRANVLYVFYSEQEQGISMGATSLEYSFLMERYNKDGTIIYQVK